LTLETRGERAGDLLSELSSRVGFTLVITPGLADKPVSVSFREVPVEEAIMRLISLLEVKNYSLSYDENGVVREVRLLEGEDKHLVVNSHGMPGRIPAHDAVSSDSGEEEGNRAEEMIEDEPHEKASPHGRILLPPRLLYIPPGR